MTGDAAQVTLITDHTTRVSARDRQRRAAITRHRRRRRWGSPNDLVLQFIAAHDDIRPGDRRLLGHHARRGCESRYPPDMPIGTVTRSTTGGPIDQKVHVAPVRRRAPGGLRPGPHATATTSRAVPALGATARRCASLVLGLIDRDRAGRGGLAGHDARRRTPTSRRSSSLSVGLLCGSVARRDVRLRHGAVRRHGAACRRSASARSSTSRVGYGAGRLRELRDPRARWTPVAVGAAATAVAPIGFSLMQFLLGVDAPVELPAPARHPRDDRRSARCWPLPVYAVVRRVLAPVLPEDPRRRRRRAYVTGGCRPMSRA